MRRIYWDTMLLIYLLDGNPKYSARVLELLKVSLRRGDRLFTSCLGLGELMAGAAKAPVPSTATEIRKQLTDIQFSYLPFDAASVDIFATLRAIHKLKSPDAINLACAGGAGIDLFLTGDKDLMKLYVPGINFIADFENPLLQL